MWFLGCLETKNETESFKFKNIPTCLMCVEVAKFNHTLGVWIYGCQTIVAWAISVATSCFWVDVATCVFLSFKLGYVAKCLIWYTFIWAATCKQMTQYVQTCYQHGENWSWQLGLVCAYCQDNCHVTSFATMLCNCQSKSLLLLPQLEPTYNGVQWPGT